MKPNTDRLLDRAKSITVKVCNKKYRVYTEEEEELTLAYLKSEITLTQVQKALGLDINVYILLARCARQIFTRGTYAINKE